MFYDIFIKLCKDKGVKPTPLVVGMGLSSSNVSQWKKGSTPRPEVLQRLADYFGVSIGYLLADEGQKDGPPTENMGGPTEIDSIFSQLSPANQTKLLELARLYLDHQHKTAESQ